VVVFSTLTRSRSGARPGALSRARAFGKTQRWCSAAEAFVIRLGFFVLTALLCACAAKRGASGAASADAATIGTRDAASPTHEMNGASPDASDAKAAAGGGGGTAAQHGGKDAAAGASQTGKDGGPNASHELDAGNDGGGRVSGPDAAPDASSTTGGTYGDACESTAACDAALTCINRQCTKTCTSDAACKGFSAMSRCISGICADVCIDMRDCAAGRQCVMTIAGSVCMHTPN
jgi:hypothetical protein